MVPINERTISHLVWKFSVQYFQRRPEKKYSGSFEVAWLIQVNCFCFFAVYFLLFFVFVFVLFHLIFSLCWLLWSIDFYSVPNHLVPDTISFTVRRWKRYNLLPTLLSRNPNHKILCMTASHHDLLETDFEPFGVINSTKLQIKMPQICSTYVVSNCHNLFKSVWYKITVW